MKKLSLDFYRRENVLMISKELLGKVLVTKFDNSLTKGPGKVAKALGLNKEHTGQSLLSKDLYILDDGFVYNKKQIIASPRIGVDYAGEDALLPYRFYIDGNPFVSGKKGT